MNFEKLKGESRGLNLRSASEAIGQTHRPPRLSLSRGQVMEALHNQKCYNQPSNIQGSETGDDIKHKCL